MERPRVDERDEPSLRSRAWLRVDELESALPESGHLLANVLAREREMMESLSPTFDEPCDRTVGLEGLEELDMNGPGPEEGHADALRRHLFREVRLQPEAAISLERVLEALHRNADVVGGSDHTSCLGLYVPNTVRMTSLISPSVALARTESKIAGTRFPSDRASSSRRWRCESTSPWLRFARSPRTCRTRSGSSCRSGFGSGTRSSPSTYAFTPTIVRSPRSSSTWTRYAESAIWRWTQPVSIALSIPPRRSVSRIRSAASSSRRSVSDSIVNEPPTGSTLLAPPISCARSCWVRSATRTAFCDWTARASSMLFVCSD